VCVTVVDREFYKSFHRSFLYITGRQNEEFLTLVFSFFRGVLKKKKKILLAGIDSELSSELSPPRERFLPFLNAAA